MSADIEEISPDRMWTRVLGNTPGKLPLASDKFAIFHSGSVGWGWVWESFPSCDTVRPTAGVIYGDLRCRDHWYDGPRERLLARKGLNK